MIPQYNYDARDLNAPDLLPASLSDAQTVEVTATWADRGLIFADNSFYSARLLGDVVVSQSAIDGIGMGGRIALTVAEIDLYNGDRALDAIASQGLITGRPAKIRTTAAPTPSRSDAGGDLSQALGVFQGKVAALSPSARTMKLALADISQQFNTPLQANLYGGTGGLDGSADLAGKPKPLSFGYRYNVTPIYLGLVDFGDGPLQTYQTHWRGIQGHTAMRERGVAMVKVTSAPGVGQWRDWPLVGCFQVGFTPNGVVTCDVQGDNVPFYAASTAQVIQRALETLGPLLSDGDLELPSFGLLDTQILGEIGWGQGTDVITTASALDDLVSHCGVWMTGNRLGQVRLALPQPLAGVSNMALDDGDIVSLAPAALPASLQPTPSIVQVAAAKNWTPLSDISSGVSAADRSTLAAPGQNVVLTSATISGRQAGARTMMLDALFRLETDAQRRGQALLTWLENGLRAFTVTTDKYLGQVEIGHVATVSYPLFGLTGGFTGVVAAWEESASKQRLTMTLVG